MYKMICAKINKLVIVKLPHRTPSGPGWRADTGRGYRQHVWEDGGPGQDASGVEE